MTRVVAITGATGGIGSKLRRHFDTVDGITLRPFCLNRDGDPDVVTADLATYDASWADSFAGVDTLIHLAGEASPQADWSSVQRLNVTLLMNVLEAARTHRIARIVFASSNWVMAGYRHGTQRLTPDLLPAPINPYGHSKLFGESVGQHLAARTGISFIALRIGWCPSDATVPSARNASTWLQQMWLSDRDLCAGFEAAVRTPNIPFATVNLMSDNPDMRWDLAETRRLLGYRPQDGRRALSGLRQSGLETLARYGHALLHRLDLHLTKRP